MKALVLLCAAMAAFSPLRTEAAEKPTALDLVGKWDGAVEFGKFKFKLVVRVNKTPANRLAVTIDIPEQGQKDVPVNAFLFNYPEVRFEIDPFGTAYNGNLTADLNSIDGAFEEGPGGRPVKLTFKRSTIPDAPEPEKTYTFAKNEPTDIRGHWKGSLEPMPGMTLTAGLNIGRLPDGTFKATLDILDQGAKDIPTSSITTTEKTAKLEWQALQTVFDAKLSEDGKSLSGEWKQGPRGKPLTFERVDGPVTLIPKNVSFEPEKGNAEDVRGYWGGTLETPGGKLRLVFKLGRTPEGKYAGTLASIDQGGRELPMSSGSFTAPDLHLEFKGIRGKFDGKLNKEGTAIEGKWEQFGNPMPLILERTTAPEADKTVKS